MTTNHVKPIVSLKEFCSKIIDYAGLFPPASLELGQAFHNFVYYSQGEYRWMLNKFIIPAKRLAELGTLMDDMIINGKVSLSVLGTGSENVSEFNELFKSDITSVKEFISKYPGTVSVDAFEVRLPSEIFKNDDNSEIQNLVSMISTTLENTLGRNIPAFFEVSLTNNYEAEIIRTVETIGAIDRGCGYKLRTGGIEPSAFPEPEVIAFAIMTCCEFDVPMKCTAGLHHPIRHYNEEVKANMHGFMNVFAAGILAYTSNLDEAEIIEVLTDQDPYEFVFTENGFTWNENEVTISEIKAAREKFMLSYGSCSFDEPIDDLKTMELF
ncbi:MAG TPA: hypothetical protein VG961_04655 [Ignavibacteria bacterium]|nr:hypothetical protein [Ignavibacteria bacterium]